MHNKLLEAELSARALDGQFPVTIREMGARFAALGYRLDRSLDCRSLSQWMTGPRAGTSHPVCSTGLKEADTGLSAFNVNARRDDNFRAMQELRSEVFAVTRDGYILEV